MAGIGFQLRRLAQQDTISAILAAAGHAAVIAAGPWLFTIFALAVITLVTDVIAGTQTLSNFRVVVIYAFAISLVFASPIQIVATRLVGDALWLKRPEQVPALMLGAFVSVLPPAAAASLFAIWWFALALPTALVLTATTLIVALIWIALAFCGAVRDYRGVTNSFLAGLAVSLVVTSALALLGFEAVGMAWGFASGLTLILVGLTSRILATFPQAVTDPMASISAIGSGMRHYARLVAGAFIGSAAVWIDKVIFWFSSEGSRLDNGLLHAPAYDSTMFIASLTLVPSLATFVMTLETGFFDRYQKYFATIASHGTLRQIEDARQRLATFTLDSLAVITVTLAAIAGILILTAPAVVETLGLQFRQIAILRYGALGAVFHFVLIAASAVLLFFDRRRKYLILQCLFFALNAGLTIASLQLGEDFYGTGYFVACLVSAAVAYGMADSTFERLNFLTFLGNNPSIVGGRGPRFFNFPRLRRRA